MMRFVCRSVVFAMMTTGIIGGLCAWEIVSEIRKYREEVRAPESATILLCGDSQLGNSVDPSLAPQFFNFSAHGRALDQDYLVMLDILKANPGHFKKVVIDVSPAAATWPLDKPLGEMSFSAGYFLIHFLHPDRNTRDLSGSFRVVRDYLVGKRLRLAWRAIRGKADFHSSLYGHFTPIPDSNRRDNPTLYLGLLKQKAELTSGAGDVGEGAPMFEVLGKIADAAERAEVEPVVVTTPWNRELIELCGEAELDRFTAKIARWSASRHLRYFNFLKAEFDDECWLDANHLNLAGSRVFTGMLLSTIERKE